MHGDRHVARDRLRPGRLDRIYSPSAPHHSYRTGRGPLTGFMMHLLIGEGGLGRGTPVHHALAPINCPRLESSAERGQHRPRIGRVHREMGLSQSQEQPRALSCSRMIPPFSLRIPRPAAETLRGPCPGGSSSAFATPVPPPSGWRCPRGPCQGSKAEKRLPSGSGQNGPGGRGCPGSCCSARAHRQDAGHVGGGMTMLYGFRPRPGARRKRRPSARPHTTSFRPRAGS